MCRRRWAPGRSAEARYRGVCDIFGQSFVSERRPAFAEVLNRKVLRALEELRDTQKGMALSLFGGEAADEEIADKVRRSLRSIGLDVQHVKLVPRIPTTRTS